MLEFCLCLGFFSAQMALPMADCSSYMVGNCPESMKEHTLPQLRAFKQKRKQLMVSLSLLLAVAVMSRIENSTALGKNRLSFVQTNPPHYELANGAWCKAVSYKKNP